MCNPSLHSQMWCHAKVISEVSQRAYGDTHSEGRPTREKRPSSFMKSRPSAASLLQRFRSKYRSPRDAHNFPVSTPGSDPPHAAFDPPATRDTRSAFFDFRGHRQRQEDSLLVSLALRTYFPMTMRGAPTDARHTSLRPVQEVHKPLTFSNSLCKVRRYSFSASDLSLAPTSLAFTRER